MVVTSMKVKNIKPKMMIACFSLLLCSCSATEIKEQVSSMIDKVSAIPDILMGNPTNEQETINSFETGKPGRWQNPDPKEQISITPVSSFENAQGQQCHKFQLAIDGERNKNGKACKNDETGRWEILHKGLKFPLGPPN